MDVITDKTIYGLPSVTWIQMLPKTSQGSRFRFQAIVGGMIVGGLAGLFANGFYGLLMGVFFGGGIGGLLFNKTMQQPGQREWGERPVLMPSMAQAAVTGPVDGEYTFHWSYEYPEGNKIRDSVPLSSFDVFEVGSMNEWFAGADDRQKYGDTIAIVLHSTVEGTKCVAKHAGARAEVSKLHGVLTREFVTNRAALSGVNAPQAHPSAPTARPSDDLPTAL
jgi:hypothetical protein